MPRPPQMAYHVGTSLTLEVVDPVDSSVNTAVFITRAVSFIPTFVNICVHTRKVRLHSYLRFIFNCILYQWAVILFGISMALLLFTRISKPIATDLHLRNVQFESQNLSLLLITTWLLALNWFMDLQDLASDDHLKVPL